MHKGTRIDGVRSIADLKGRCVINDESGCWHLRTGNGLPMPPNRSQRVWSHLHGGNLSAPRLAWLLSRPRIPLTKNERVFRTCASYDCVCPKHLRKGTHVDQGRAQAASGLARIPSRQANARRLGIARCPVDMELRAWLLESSQSNVDIAHGLDVKRYTVVNIRSYARKQARVRTASVFDLGGIIRRAA